MHSVASGSEDARSVGVVGAIVLVAVWVLQILLAYETLGSGLP